MKKTFQLEDLDCANCARKMQDAIAKLDGVTDANVDFLHQKMAITADDSVDWTKLMNDVIKVCKKVEPDCTILL